MKMRTFIYLYGLRFSNNIYLFLFKNYTALEWAGGSD